MIDQDIIDKVELRYTGNKYFGKIYYMDRVLVRYTRWLEKARILSTEGLAILDKDQILPERSYFNENNKDEELELSGHTQMDMVKAGYKKVLPTS